MKHTILILTLILALATSCHQRPAEPPSSDVTKTDSGCYSDEPSVLASIKLDHEFWARVCKYDLSHSVICADSIATFEITSWWNDEMKMNWLRFNDSIPNDNWPAPPTPLGFRGPKYQKFDIHYSSVTKVSDTEYSIKGLTRCEGKILPIQGTITLDTLVALEHYRTLESRDEQYPIEHHYTEVGIGAHYLFTASQNGKAVAELSGNVIYKVLEYDGQIYYDAMGLLSDSYCNNQYEGVWTDLRTRKTLTCNWGDYRIPNPGDLDIGCGEFSVNKKYMKYGWQLCHDDPDTYEKDCLWWKEKP